MSSHDLGGNDGTQPGQFVSIATEDTGQGTGFGLSRVFGFARQLGGHVAPRSAPGHGTGIALVLPQFVKDAE